MKICIVGSSFASAVITENLSKLGFQIDVVDIGDIEKIKKKTHLQIKRPTSLNLKANEFQYHGRGGGSNLWHGVITNFDRIDIKNFIKVGIKFKEIYKKFSKSSLSFLDINNKFKNFKLFKNNKVINECYKSGLLDLKYFLVQKKPFNTRDKFLKMKNFNNINLIKIRVL